TLATAFTLETRATLPEAQCTALHQQLETLQGVLTRLWPLVRMPTEHPLVPFALVAQEQLAPLWGLRTGGGDAWATLPVPVARALQTAMAAVLAEWEMVTAAMPTGRSSAPAEETLPRALPPDGKG